MTSKKRPSSRSNAPDNVYVNKDTLADIEKDRRSIDDEKPRSASVGVLDESRMLHGVVWCAKAGCYRMYRIWIPLEIVEEYLVDYEDDTAALIEAKTSMHFTREVVGL